MKLFALAMLLTAKADPLIRAIEDGHSEELAIVGTYAKGNSAGDGITLPHGGRVYVANKEGNGKVVPNELYRPNLLGGSISYDVNLSQSGCRCNASFYMVLMPGKYSNGVPDPARGGDYYCDANDVGGAWCPEMDIMEASTYNFHTTPHRCDKPTNKGHYYNCDRGGCGKNIFSIDKRAYGPGS